jgi:hypothetical protein
MNEQKPLKPSQTFNKMQFRQICAKNNRLPRTQPLETGAWEL